jgi:carbamoyl-phosphate synthase small subunit
MQYGHHGANHPVQDLKTGKVLITSQNHNFAVSELSLPKNLIITHRSLFDGSLQGFQHTYKPIYGFQGHPEAGPGPSDGKKLFDPFISMMRSRRLCQKDQI